MQKQYGPLHGVIFDLDNTLVSSTLNFKQIRADIGCPPHTDILTYIEGLSEHDGKSAMSKVLEHEYADAEQAELMPGVLDCLSQLNDNHIQLAVVTRNCSRAANIKLNKTGLVFEHVLSRDDAPAKPDPTALLMVAKRWQLNPTHCVYVGDYLFDIQAAHNASMLSALYSPITRPDYAAQADYEFQHFSQLAAFILN